MEQDSTTDGPVTGWVNGDDGRPVLRYEVESNGQVLRVEWQDGPTLDDVKRGFLALTQLLAEHHCPALLSDSNHFSGDWSELIPWIRYEFLPRAIGNGLRYLADVLPPDPASSFSVYRWREETRGLLHHGVFDNLDAARAWVTNELRAEARTSR